MTEPEGIGPLFTDLYELTMAAGYFAHRIDASATFSLYIRDSGSRNFFVAAGLEDALKAIESLRFSKDERRFLQNTGLFSDRFVDFLGTFRFTGTIRAMPEGTVCFPGEPLLEVTAPIIEAQILETFLLNAIGFPTLIASKAARCVHAAQGRPLMDFSLRRTHGRDAGMNVARSTYIAGFSSTSNVLAGKRLGIPIAGTMAHSFVTAFESEIDAFTAYAETFPDSAIFLIDTYDTVRGAQNAAAVALDMRKRGRSLRGVRLDSGDMAELSIQVRGILDKAGLTDVKIYASSGFDEFTIADVLNRGARIDAFGVGTKVGVSADSPYLDVVYKLVRYGKRNVRKQSSGKATLAGEKQVFRAKDSSGRYAGDDIGTRDEQVQGAEPLLTQVMKGGRVTPPHPSLAQIRQRFARGFSFLPEKYKSLDKKTVYPVRVSARLSKLQKPEAENHGESSPERAPFFRT